MHPDYYNLVEDSNKKIVIGEEFEIEYKIISSIGIVKFKREKTRVIVDESTIPIKVVGYIQDVTLEKNREAYLNTLSDNLIEAQRISNLGSWKHDLTNDRYFTTDQVFTINGITREEFEQNNTSGLKWVHQDDHHLIKDSIKDYLNGKPSIIQYRVSQKDGSIKYVESKSESLFDEDGKVSAAFGTLQDVTENTLLEQELQKSLDLTNQTEALAHVGSWGSNIITGETHWSNETYRIFRLPIGSSVGNINAFDRFIHPEDINKLKKSMSNPSKTPVELEYRILNPDGSIKYIYGITEFLFNEEGVFSHIHGTIQDITEMKILQQEIKEKAENIHQINRRFEALIKESMDVIEILDKNGNVLYISDAVERVTGHKPAEIIGKSIFSFYGSSEANKLKGLLAETLKKDQKRIVDTIPYISKLGQKQHLEFSAQNFIDDDIINGIVIVFRDVTRRVEYENRILHASYHDTLTGLPNKLHFDKIITELTEEVQSPPNFGVVMLDVEKEKYIREFMRYNIVENFIKKIALRIKLYCGDDVFLSRYSEGRFVLIVKGENVLEECQKIIKDIYSIFRQPITVEMYELEVLLSIGVSLNAEDKIINDSIVERAETALTIAKTEGKNKAKFYSSDLDIQSYKHFVLRNDLTKAISENQLRVYFQPFVNLKTNEIIGAEALIRWQHPEWGIISPTEFIKIAEETGYIVQIGKWILKEVCTFYKVWIEEGLKPIKLSINYSSMQFFETGFVENLINTINEFKLDPRFLIMEMTENILITETEKVIEDINQLQSYGIQIALDDFGTGYSSLAYLSRFNIDILKIDGSFVKNININESSTIILHHMIKMAQSLNIKLVGERIENWTQLSFLQELNCYTGQGYIFSPPVPADDFRLLLQKRTIKPQKTLDKQFVKEKRKFFRVEFRQFLEAELTILEIGNKKINAGNTKVLIKNIGPGGLCFISNIRLPIDKDIILQFISEVNGNEFRINGNTVWTNEVDENIFEYGVEFYCDENKRAELIRILGKTQILMKKDILFADGRFVSGSPFQYFNPTIKK